MIIERVRRQLRIIAQIFRIIGAILFIEAIVASIVAVATKGCFTCVLIQFAVMLAAISFYAAGLLILLLLNIEESNREINEHLSKQ